MKLSEKEFNLPNILTVLRVLSVPFFIYFLISNSQTFKFIAFILFTLASITDLIDGYLARKWKQETELGKFLDPLADKFLVLGAFVTFLFLSDQVEIWMVLCIVARDMLITVLRYRAVQKGISLRTSMFGKIKTTFQMFAIGIILISLFWISYRETSTINSEFRLAAAQGIYPWEVAGRNFMKFRNGEYSSIYYGLATFLPYYLMLVTTIVTIISGLRYLFTNFSLLLPPYFAVSAGKPKVDDGDPNAPDDTDSGSG